MKKTQNSFPMKNQNGSNQVLQLIDQHHLDITDEVKNYMGQNFTLIQQFFTDKKIVELVKKAKFNKVKSETEFRQRVLDIAIQAKINNIEQVADSYIKTNAIILQSELRDEYTKYIRDFQLKMLENVKTIQRAIYLHYKELDEYNDAPFIRARVEQALDRSLKDLIDFFEQERQNLVDIIQKKFF